MKWQQVSNRDQLESLGSYNEVRAKVKSDIEKQFSHNSLKIDCKLHGRGWEKLLESIKDYQVLTSTLSNQKQADSYFASAEDKVIFALIEMNGSPQLKTLGVTKRMFSNSKDLKSWYKKTCTLIHPDKSDHPDAQSAFNKLETLYTNIAG